ncbi:MAG: hypothetical protein AAF827_22020 [Cyanobacteria bacterium P01_D01_bin.6]
MLDALQPFGAPDCESDLEILGESLYSEYYFDSVHFNRNPLDPFVYLISGRRGAGKTALAKFFSFQQTLEHAADIDVDEPAAFHEVISQVIEPSDLNRDLQIPQLVKIWEYVIWSAIFYKLKQQDIRIQAMCQFSEEGGLSCVIRSLLQAVINRYVDSNGSLYDDLEGIFRSAAFEEAKKAVLEISEQKPLFISVDTLEKYSIHDEKLMMSVAALVEFAAVFCRRYAPKGLYIKVFIMDEMFPYLMEEYISNTLKYVKNEVYLHWKPKDLMKIICWRLFRYLRLKSLTQSGTALINWKDHRDIKEQVWKKYFGEVIDDYAEIQEKTFPFILRHTHLRPRQLIVLCNAIAEQALMFDEFPKISSRSIVAGVEAAGEILAQEIFNAYSAVYPNAARIADALSGIPPIFKGKELDKRAHRTASQWSDEYSPYRFRQFVAELGIVGRVRQSDRSQTMIEADFEYFQTGRLILADDDLCAIHPMFYRKLNVRMTEKVCVYPFPDHQDYRLSLAS